MAEKDKAVQFFKAGMAEFIDGNYGNSIETLSRAIELEPNHKIALMSRGAGYMKMDRAEDAMADYGRVIELDPDYPRAYHLRGLAHERSGDNKAALHDFNRAIEIDPSMVRRTTVVPIFTPNLVMRSWRQKILKRRPL